MTDRRRRVLRVTAVVVGIAVAYVLVTAVQVWRAAHSDDTGPADAIIVLGAAQYDGRPSPVLAARLDHVIDLYEAGMAGYIVVTGGNRPGDRFTEAGASARYLAAHGVPGGVVERETTGASSYESLAATARFLRSDAAVEEVLLVSDPYHSYRIAAIADDVGLDARVSPAPTSLYSWWSQMQRFGKETIAVAAGRVIGFRRLDRFDG